MGKKSRGSRSPVGAASPSPSATDATPSPAPPSTPGGSSTPRATDPGGGAAPASPALTPTKSGVKQQQQHRHTQRQDTKQEGGAAPWPSFAPHAFPDELCLPESLGSAGAARPLDVWARVTCTDDPRQAREELPAPAKQGAKRRPPAEPPQPVAPCILQLHAPQLLAKVLRQAQPQGTGEPPPWLDPTALSLGQVLWLRQQVELMYPTQQKGDKPHESQAARQAVSDPRPRAQAWDTLEAWYRERLRHQYGHLPQELLDVFRVDLLGNVVALEASTGSICSFSTDHIFPWSRGGRSTDNNLMALADPANISKGNQLWTFIVQWREGAPAPELTAPNAIAHPLAPTREPRDPQSVPPTQGPTPPRVLGNFTLVSMPAAPATPPAPADAGAAPDQGRRTRGAGGRGKGKAGSGTKPPHVLCLRPVAAVLSVGLFVELWAHLQRTATAAAAAAATATPPPQQASPQLFHGDAGPLQVLKAMLLQPWPQLLRARHARLSVPQLTTSLAVLASSYLVVAQKLARHVPLAADLDRALGGTGVDGAEAVVGAVAAVAAAAADEQGASAGLEEEDVSGEEGEEEGSGDAETATAGATTDDPEELSGVDDEPATPPAVAAGAALSLLSSPPAAAAQAAAGVPPGLGVAAAAAVQGPAAGREAPHDALLRQLDALLLPSPAPALGGSGGEAVGQSVMDRLSRLISELHDRGAALPAGGGSGATAQGPGTPEQGDRPAALAPPPGPLEPAASASPALQTLQQARQALQAFAAQQRQQQQDAGREQARAAQAQHQQLQLWGAWFGELKRQQADHWRLVEAQGGPHPGPPTYQMPTPPPGLPPPVPRPQPRPLAPPGQGGDAGGWAAEGSKFASPARPRWRGAGGSVDAPPALGGGGAAQQGEPWLWPRAAGGGVPTPGVWQDAAGLQQPERKVAKPALPVFKRQAPAHGGNPNRVAPLPQLPSGAQPAVAEQRRDEEEEDAHHRGARRSFFCLCA